MKMNPKLTEETIHQISENLNEPKWLLETRLDAMESLEGLKFPDVIKTPGRVWTDLADLDFCSFVDLGFCFLVDLDLVIIRMIQLNYFQLALNILKVVNKR